LQEVIANYEDLGTTINALEIDSPDVDLAGENISAYVRDVCGLDIGS
jgi:hypothetical protein